jgi:hypothetical protein
VERSFSFICLPVVNVVLCCFSFPCFPFVLRGHGPHPLGLLDITTGHQRASTSWSRWRLGGIFVIEFGGEQIVPPVRDTGGGVGCPVVLPMVAMMVVLRLVVVGDTEVFVVGDTEVVVVNGTTCFFGQGHRFVVFVVVARKETGATRHTSGLSHRRFARRSAQINPTSVHLRYHCSTFARVQV